MSCQHGNPYDACDICDEINEAWRSGYASGIAEFDCVGVIDADGNIYPDSPESGEQMFIKRVKP